MKGKIYFLTTLIIVFLLNTSYGQLDYSVVDDFNRANNNTLGTASSGFNAWTENEEADNDDQLQISGNRLYAITSDVTGLEPTNASINFSNELDSSDLGTNNLGWSFHFEIMSAPTGWGADNYSLGWVLAANENDFSSATVDGYAVLWTATNEELVLIKFQDGITGADPGTAIINTGLTYQAGVTDAVNVRIEVDALGNWSMWWETGIVISDPLHIDANTATSASAHTDYFDDAGLVYTGPIWAHASDARYGYYENFNMGGNRSDLNITNVSLNTNPVLTGTSTGFSLI